MADAGAARCRMRVSWRANIVADFFPFVVKPHDAVGCCSNLAKRRSRKTPDQDGFDLLPIEHGNLLAQVSRVIDADSWSHFAIDMPGYSPDFRHIPIVAGMRKMRCSQRCRIFGSRCLPTKDQGRTGNQGRTLGLTKQGLSLAPAGAVGVGRRPERTPRTVRLGHDSRRFRQSHSESAGPVADMKE